MDQRASYFIQVLTKIGTPLLTAVMDAGAASEGAEAAEAKKMAELLSRTVQGSIELGHLIDRPTLESGGDSLRVALAALAAPLIAKSFAQSGKAPGEAELKKFSGALQAVMTFSENFTPGAEATLRLDALESMGQPVDAAQAGVQYIRCFVPVVSAIAAFPFGQPEQKLVMDVAGRLSQRAVQIREAAGLAGDDAAQKAAELCILDALARLYAQCHEAETRRLMSMTEDQRAALPGGGMSLDSVWKAYDTRALMLETLALGMMPQSGAQKTGSARAPQPLKSPEAPAVKTAAAPQESANPMAGFAAKPKTDAPAPPATPAPAAPQAESAPPAQGNGNPMAFFKAPKKQAEGGAE